MINKMRIGLIPGGEFPWEPVERDMNCLGETLTLQWLCQHNDNELKKGVRYANDKGHSDRDVERSGLSGLR
jgi:hypothetical protein